MRALLPPQASTPAAAYSPLTRTLAGTLVTLSRGSLPAILGLVVLATDPPVTPPLLIRLVLTFTVLPGLAAWILRRACAAEIEVEPDAFTVRRRHLRIEIPPSAIADVMPWRVPLPGPGLSLRLRSGRRLDHGVQVRDPVPLLRALSEQGSVAAARAALEHPSMVWAHARAMGPGPRWHHLAGKFLLFALGPTAVLFNAHQHISYGGTFGQMHLEGLGPYLRTFGIYWGTTAIYLVLYASAWRGLGEVVALGSAYVAPSLAARVRRAVEITCRTVYYGGVPVLLLLRFLG